MLPVAAETGQAVLDVRRVARLAHLAVVDDVDARFGLLADDFLDGGRDTARAAPSESTGTPSSFAYIIRIRSSGRGRLPVCVVKNRSVLRFIGISLLRARTRHCPPNLRDNVPVRLSWALSVFVLFLPPLVTAQAPVQLDPFAQATAGLPACAVVKPRLYTSDEMRTEAHTIRSERGTRCARSRELCAGPGAYKRDTEINDHVRAVIAADQRFTQTSIWITTSRKWVTLKGCVRTSAQRNALFGVRCESSRTSSACSMN